MDKRRVGRPIKNTSPEAARSIDLWFAPKKDRNLRKLGIRKSESLDMRKVMRETDGEGGPWFYQYAIKKGLL